MLTIRSSPSLQGQFSIRYESTRYLLFTVSFDKRCCETMTAHSDSKWCFFSGNIVGSGIRKYYLIQYIIIQDSNHLNVVQCSSFNFEWWILSLIFDIRHSKRMLDWVWFLIFTIQIWMLELSLIFDIRHSKFECWIEFDIRYSPFKFECWIKFDVRYLRLKKNECWIEFDIQYSTFKFKCWIEFDIRYLRFQKNECWIEFDIQYSTFKFRCWIEFDIRYLTLKFEF